MRAFKRITFHKEIMGGQACIRGMRIPVSLVINLVANGMTARTFYTIYGIDLQHHCSTNPEDPHST